MRCPQCRYGTHSLHTASTTQEVTLQRTLFDSQPRAQHGQMHARSVNVCERTHVQAVCMYRFVNACTRIRLERQLGGELYMHSKTMPSHSSVPGMPFRRHAANLGPRVTQKKPGVTHDIGTPMPVPKHMPLFCTSVVSLHLTCLLILGRGAGHPSSTALVRESMRTCTTAQSVTAPHMGMRHRTRVEKKRCMGNRPN